MFEMAKSLFKMAKHVQDEKVTTFLLAVWRSLLYILSSVAMNGQ